MHGHVIVMLNYMYVMSSAFDQTLLHSKGVGQASRVSIIAESAQGRHAETCTFFH